MVPYWYRIRTSMAPEPRTTSLYEDRHHRLLSAVSWQALSQKPFSCHPSRSPMRSLVALFESVCLSNGDDEAFVGSTPHRDGNGVGFTELREAARAAAAELYLRHGVGRLPDDDDDDDARDEEERRGDDPPAPPPPPSHQRNPSANNTPPKIRPRFVIEPFPGGGGGSPGVRVSPRPLRTPRRRDRGGEEDRRRPRGLGSGLRDRGDRS